MTLFLPPSNKHPKGQAIVELTLVAVLVILAVASSLAPVKDVIENQSRIAAKSVSADGLEVSGTTFLRKPLEIPPTGKVGRGFYNKLDKMTASTTVGETNN